MKFTISKKHLLNSIQEVTNAISSRIAVIPILTGMKMELRRNDMILTGSNSDITIQSQIPAKLEDEEIITNIEEGSLVVPVPHFPDIIRKLPDGLVNIDVEDNNKMVIKSGRAVFTLYGQSSEDYPHFNFIQDDGIAEIKVSQLKKLIRQTVFAISTMETRPVLTGVHVTIINNVLTFTATDSHRLALRSTKLQQTELDDIGIVIPGKSLLELNKVLHQDDDIVQISLLKNQVLFRTRNTYFLSRLLNGTYPDTGRLIPNESKTKLHLNTKDLIHTIERAALLSSSDQNNVIRLDTLGDSQIEISSNSPEIGNVKEQLAIVYFEGEELKISFSSRYMLDTLKTLDSEEVEINFAGPMKPFIIRIPNEHRTLHLILPVRTY